MPACLSAQPILRNRSSAAGAAGCSRCHGRKRCARTLGVDQCPVSAGSEFYIRKDSNPKVSLTVVVIGAFISAVFYWLGKISSPTAFLGERP